MAVREQAFMIEIKVGRVDLHLLWVWRLATECSGWTIFSISVKGPQGKHLYHINLCTLPGS